LVDDVDSAIIQLLKIDSRQPILALARAVNLSRTTVQDRVRRLVKTGVIKRFTVEVERPDSRMCKGFLFVNLDRARCAAERLCKSSLAEIRRWPEVDTVNFVAGQVDVVITVCAATLSALHDLRTRTEQLPGVTTAVMVPIMASSEDV
jgi:Lrp/AsnC family transcriptional regulator, leucine-responsive regulatory protein